MFKKVFIVSMMAAMLLGGVFSATQIISAFARHDDVHANVRVLAHTDEEVTRAAAKGCQEVRRVRELHALECDAAAAEALGLPEDIKVFAFDSGANVRIGATSVHTAGNTGAGRTIVVLDTGYNYSHPELSSSFLGGRDFINNDNDPMDDNGHGSHVAGLITADGINIGARGAAPDAGIISGKVLAANGGGYFSDIIAAIYWAVNGPDGVYGTADDFGADAISMSLGTMQPYTYKGFCDSVFSDMTNAVKYAVDRGVAVVVASGNNGSAGVSIPGCISYATTVGAVDSFDKIASFSGKGKAVDISAPGVGLLSSWLGSSYLSASGTSMATPVVSATVALIKFAHPSYTVMQTEQAFFTTAKDLWKHGWDNNYGWGRVNAAAAVNY